MPATAEANMYGIRCFHSNLSVRRYSQGISNPLNILFFGSDEFSIHSLRALKELQLNGKSSVEDIQVVTRKPKWCGRQKSILKYTPIIGATEEFNLPEPILCDTKQDLVNIPGLEKYNMIIAVSFGKLIPSELIGKMNYSLNVHPSLLPRYRGASPIQYALLNNDKYVGVTIQTLHPEKFDHGAIVAQTSPLFTKDLLLKGISSKFEENTPPKTATLMDQLGKVGGTLLEKVITEKLYMPGNHLNYSTGGIESSYAPRISANMKFISWANDSAVTLLNKLGAIGPVYSFKEASVKGALQLKRVLLHKFEISDLVPVGLNSPGDFSYDPQSQSIFIKCAGDTFIRVNELQYEGFKIETAEQFSRRLKMRCGPELCNKTSFL